MLGRAKERGPVAAAPVTEVASAVATVVPGAAAASSAGPVSWAVAAAAVVVGAGVVGAVVVIVVSLDLEHGKAVLVSCLRPSDERFAAVCQLSVSCRLHCCCRLWNESALLVSTCTASVRAAIAHAELCAAGLRCCTQHRCGTRQEHHIGIAAESA